MIKVNVEFILSDNKDHRTIYLHEGQNISDLFSIMGYYVENYISIVDNKNRLKDYILQDEDVVKIFPAMCGG